MEHKHSPLSPAWIARRRYEVGYTGKTFNSDSPDSEYQRDRARIIHSASFRRLQSKTQIFSIGDSDFYRTRLTHSLEVAQIGSGICERLREVHKDQPDIHAWIPSMGLIEAICLGHDLGHPPFGHGGEVALNSVMHAYGGFEGNGQTLRIISRLGEYSPEHGLDLTRRTMLGLLKYPVLHHEVANYPPAPLQQSSNIDHAQPPKCLHDDEADVLEWIVATLPELDRQRLRQHQLRSAKHGKSLYKGLDTSIMELADDIAYGVHDLEDALAMELVTARQWQELVMQPAQSLSTSPLMLETDFYQQKLFSGSDRERKHAISRLVNYFIDHISISTQDDFESPLLHLQAGMDEEAYALLSILKGFVKKVVIRSPQVQALEFKGQHMIMRLFTTLLENAERLLPTANLAQLQQGGSAERVICDYIASMTDIHATRLYHRLFSPDIGSVFDK